MNMVLSFHIRRGDIKNYSCRMEESFRGEIEGPLKSFYDVENTFRSPT